MAGKPLSRKAAQLKGALVVYLQPKLAQDAKIDLNPIVRDVHNKNYGEKKTSLLANLTAALKGKLAQDVDITELPALIEALEEVEEEEGIDAEGGTDPNAGAPMGKEKAREFLGGKLSSEDMATYDAMMGPEMKPEGADGKAKDEPAENEEMVERIKKEKEKKASDADKDKDKDEEAEDEEEDKPVSKGAMDAAIKAASAKAAKDAEQRMLVRQRAVREAEKAVKPYVGELTVAMDSAEDIYKLALTHMGVDLTDVPTVGYKALLKAIPVPGSKSKREGLANDAAGSASFLEMFPDAARIDTL